jgi:type II secretory ATPase GspE/PulE/Tfp pilus assembly ATPase PilB-like protein
MRSIRRDDCGPAPGQVGTVSIGTASVGSSSIDSGSIGLGSIGLDRDDLDTVRRLLRAPSGLIILAGPHGAGLRTSAAAMLGYLNAEGRCQGAGILYRPRLEGSGRVSSALRAAERGRLVLAVVRHDRACGVLTLLRAWGADRLRVADTLVLILAQRLLPALCRACRVKDDGDEIRRILAPAASTWMADRAIQAHRAAPPGCAACAGTGLAGRFLAYEMVEVDVRARCLIGSGAEGFELESALLAGGRTLWDRALLGLASGCTSIDALHRALREPR